MTLRLPETLMRLPEPERDMLIRAGLQEAMRARIRQLKAEIAEGRKQIRRFEARYGMPLLRFETDILPHEDSLQVHDDYNDWFYWQSVVAEKERLLANLQGLRLK
jgi:hypothetical protein